VPHVPPTQAWPPPHWLFAVHWVQVPLMHVRPIDREGPGKGGLQSWYVEQAPQTLLMQA
jgi:hypothetical protein